MQVIQGRFAQTKGHGRCYSRPICHASLGVCGSSTTAMGRTTRTSPCNAVASTTVRSTTVTSSTTVLAPESRRLKASCHGFSRLAVSTVLAVICSRRTATAL